MPSQNEFIPDTVPLTFDETELETSIPARFQHVLRCLPRGQLAQMGADGQRTYQDIDRESQRLAASLVDIIGEGRAPGAQQAVSLVLPHEGSSLVGVLGVLQAGHFYVPLAPNMNEAYSRQILQDCTPQAVVTTSALLAQTRRLMEDFRPAPILMIDDLRRDWRAGFRAEKITPQAYASVQYTSGSTNRPRGVIRTHTQNLYTAYLSFHDLGFRPGDRVAHLMSYAYAWSNPQLFGALLSGATLCTRSAQSLAPAVLYQWLQECQITVLTATPGTLRGLADLGNDYPPLNTVRAVSTGAQPLSRQEIKRLAGLLPTGCRLEVKLASTEANTYARFVLHIGAPWDGSLTPAGYVPDRTQVIILDEAGRPAAPDTAGEIAVRSRYLSAGYWNRPELTAARYLPDPDGGDRRVFLTGDRGRMAPDGLLEYLGRTDFMVKVRGYRVEPESIERALMAHPNLHECVVVARPSRDGGSQLIAYLVACRQSAPSVRELRSLLAQTLPDYMIPSRFVFLDHLPRNANNKVDRQALPSPGAARPELGNPFVAPRSTVEAQLAGIWEDVLSIQPIGVQDSFRDLGGDSLSYFALLLRVEEEFGKPLATSAMLQASTVEQMAELLQQSACSLAPLPASLRVRGYASYLARRMRWLWSPRALPGGGQRMLGKYASRAGAALGGAVLPYRTGSGIISWMSGQQWIRSTLYRRQLRDLQQCLMSAPPDPIAETDVVRLSVASNVWNRWRIRALSRLAAHEFEQWVHVSGLSTFTEAFKAGRGVVLVQSHVASGRVMREALRRAGFNLAFTLGGDHALQEVYGSSLLASQLYEAKRILEQGGILQVVADGYAGTSPGIVLPFFGRTRTFRSGFAELAVSTGAAAVPAAVSMETGGHIDVRFLPPLEVPDLDRHLQVESLVLQYFEILRKEWTGNLGSFSWRHLERFQLLPPASESVGVSGTRGAG